MEPKASRSLFRNQFLRQLVSTLCAIVLVPGDPAVLATPMAQTDTGQQTAATIPADQLDSLVAPIALYPDPLLTQTLVASTYPLEVIQLQQWMGQNKNLKDNALADAVKKQDWDPSIQALAAFPDVVKLLSENIKWTTDLGNAFLAQQNDVMDAVQRMRTKAKNAGNLKSTEQQKVETKVVENKQVIIVEQASPSVVYVPSYNPTVVYGAAPIYAYPLIAYPPVGYYAASMAISFGVGVAMGAAWGGGGWGWNCGWGGHNNVYINNNNNFISNSNRNFNNQNINNRNVNYSNRTTSGSGNTWQHNPQHRGGAPYGDRTTANRYGGTTSGESMASRQQNAQRNQAQRGGVQQAGQRGGLQQASERGSLGGAQPGAPNRNAGGRGQPGVGDRTAGGRDAGNRGAGVNAGNRGAIGSGGGDRIGNRSVPSGGGGGAFGGGGGGFNGGNARASSSRGASSFGGGGARGGGGGRRR